MNAIAKAWTFRSSSSTKTYETLLYSDGATSCDCPGWTRRTQQTIDAHHNVVTLRSCRHTRSVDMDTADSEAINFHDYNEATPPIPKSEIRTPRSVTPILQYGARKLAI